MQSNLIVQLASQYIHSSLGGWAAASLAIENEIPLNVLDLNINQPMEKLFAQIASYKPTCLGFSCYIWNIEWVLKLANGIHALFPNCFIFLGGPEVQGRQMELIKEPFISAIITGEGEEAILALLSNVPLSEINGLHYKEKNEIIHTPKRKQDTIPSPYCSAFFEQLQGRIAYIETTRGCPFSCTFCLSGKEKGLTILPLSIAIERIDQLACSGSQTIKFVDRTFNAHKTHSRGLWKYLIDNYEKYKDKRFHFEIAADLLQEEDFNLLQQVPNDYFQMEAGIQSFNEFTLSACKRKMNSEKLYNCLSRLIALKTIPIHIDLIAGLPYEDYNSFLVSFDKAYSLHADQLQLGFLKLLYDCALKDESDLHGYIASPYPPYEIMQNNVLSFDDLLKLKDMATIVDVLSNHGRFTNTLTSLFKQTGLCPSKLFLRLSTVAMPLFAQRKSHSDFILGLLTILPKALQIDEIILRDALLLDELTHSKQGALPKALQKDDERLPLLKKQNKQDGALVRVGIMYQYQPNKAVVVKHFPEKPPEIKLISL